jgi:Helix-turn-helix domain
VPGATTGIGPALREARTSRGITVDEASRDTKIKPSYLRALEREQFDSLQGEVYVRGFLRSYSSYLGLDPDKVVSAYAGDGVAEPPAVRPPRPTRAERRGLRLLHRTANYRLALALAVVLIGVFAAVGLLTGQEGLAPAEPPQPTLVETSDPAVAPFVVVQMEAEEPVHARVLSDGDLLFDDRLLPGRRVEFTASTLLKLRLDRGGVVALTVNGHDLGVAGDPRHPFVGSFTPEHFMETTSESE